MAEAFSKDIFNIVKREKDRLLKISEEDAGIKPSFDKWSKKEMLGHLIDSASNNHQRFTRAQFTDRLVFPAYDGTKWVQCQNYINENWQHLVMFWSTYNLHLAHMISQIPPEKFFVQCKIGEANPMILEALIAEYIRHMERHLKKI